MRSVLITTVLALCAVVPATLAGTTNGGSLQARAPANKARAHGTALRNSSLVRRSTIKKKKCVAKKATKTTTSTPTGKPDSGSGGTIQGMSPCKGIPVGATSKVTSITGPNGALDWLNCGIEDGGWTPPHIAVKDLKYVALDDAVDGIFKPCKDYIEKFKAHAQENGFPPILLAAFAMQESTCNPKTEGQGGEQGMFQLSNDKCGNAPGGNCKDVDYNMSTAAKFIKKSIEESDGNFLLALGKYNGWYDGLTESKARAARYTGCCRCQNNLDYPHQFLNGWIQGVNSYGNPKLGKYFNLDDCN